MKNYIEELTNAHKAHQAGDFAAARAGYIAILNAQPNNIEVLHALAILHVQEDDLVNAIDYFQRAINFAPHTPMLYLNLGNAYKAQQLLPKAADAFLKAIELQPDYAAALNNLGTIYYAQEKYPEAIKYYKIALAAQPEFQDAYYNLGLAQIKKSENTAAIATYEKLLQLVPHHAAANFQLGTLLLANGETEKALPYFLTIDEHHPHHFETQTNLATAYLHRGKLNQAKTHYLKALEINPDDTQVLFNLGVINMQQGNTDNAIQFYQRALKINPDLFSVQNNIGVAFLAKNHPAFALQHFRAALRLQPDNQAIQYTVSMLAQDQRLLASPPDYIKNLFDAYADHYELHLLQGLDYNVPTLLFDAVGHVINKSGKQLDILDLGCGTGLTGIPFKPFAHKLVGVDLAEKMLAVAAEKNIYDELIQNDMLSALSAYQNAFDLIIAGDALVYIGDLRTLFAATARALRKAGLFAFNTEITDKDDYIMNQSGRFSHQKNYLDHLATDNQLAVVGYQKTVTRQQNNEPVYGHLYVLEKK